MSSWAWPSAPTAAASPPADWTARCGSGTPPRRRAAADHSRARRAFPRPRLQPRRPPARRRRAELDRHGLGRRRPARGSRPSAGKIARSPASAFSPDGRRLASAGYGGLVKVWDARRSQEALTFHGPAGSGAAVAVALDPSAATTRHRFDKAARSGSSTPRPAATRRLLDGPRRAACLAAFSPDGRRSPREAASSGIVASLGRDDAAGSSAARFRGMPVWSPRSPSAPTAASSPRRPRRASTHLGRSTLRQVRSRLRRAPRWPHEPGLQPRRPPPRRGDPATSAHRHAGRGRPSGTLETGRVLRTLRGHPWGSATWPTAPTADPSPPRAGTGRSRVWDAASGAAHPHPESAACSSGRSRSAPTAAASSRPTTSAG